MNLNYDLYYNSGSPRYRHIKMQHAVEIDLGTELHSLLAHWSLENYQLLFLYVKGRNYFISFVILTKYWKLFIMVFESIKKQKTDDPFNTRSSLYLKDLLAKVI